MLYVGTFVVGVIIGIFITLLGLSQASPNSELPFIRPFTGLVRGPYRQGRLPRKTEAPDLRRIVLRPVNKDEPPSRITQALFRQRPTRKLRDEDDQ